MSSVKTLVLTLPFVAGAVSGLTWLSTAEGLPECVLAERWVSNHHSELPTELAEFSKHPLAYRKEIYRSLSRATQLRLWHEQFTRVLSFGDLTPEQRQFIVEVDKNFDRYFGAENRSVHESYAKRASELFGPASAKAIFASLGDEIVLSGSSASPQYPNCNCHSGSEILSCGVNWCIQGGGGCISKPTGCGWGWCYTCDGICVDPDQ